MVAIINPSPSLNDAFHYNENKVRDKAAEFIHAANYPKDTEKLGITDKLNMLKNLAALNQTTELNAIHISLNFHPSEQLDKEKLKAIADSYMEKIGFGKQPYLVYEHRDAAHPHIHIVTTNIKPDGKGIGMYNIGRNKSMPAVAQIEKDFGLVIAKGRGNNIWEMPPVDIQAVQYGKMETKRAIANVINHVSKQYKFTSIPELNAVLKQFNIMADRGEKGSAIYKNNGIVYRVLDDKGNKIGVPIKASAISTKPTLKNLTEKFDANKTAREPFKQGVKNAVDWVLLQNPGMSIHELSDTLKKDRIQLVLRQNDKGVLYGITYIDHKHKAVFNGSDLGSNHGREYTAKAMQERCGFIPKQNQSIKKNRDRAPFTSGQIKDSKGRKLNTYPPRQVKDSPLQAFFPKEKIRQLMTAMKAHPWQGTVSFIPEFLQATLENDQAAYEFAAKKKKRKKRRY